MQSLKAMMVVVAVMVAGTAMAQTTSTATLSSDSEPDFTVEATVLEVCRVVTQNIDFGEYDASVGANNVKGTITVRCTKRTAGNQFNLSLGAASGSLRQMSNTTVPLSAPLEYTLTYADTANVGTGEDVEIEVTASIEKDQWEAQAGSYSETVTASIVF